MNRLRRVATLLPLVAMAMLAPTALSMATIPGQETPEAPPLVGGLSSESLNGLAPGLGSRSPGHTLIFASGLSEARYRAHEATLGTNDLHEVLGTAAGVAGSVAVDPVGAGLNDGSHLAIDLRTLTTDQPARDEIVRTAVLDTAAYPLSKFYTTGLDDLGVWPSEW
jgi:hypothetical protein